MSLKTHQSELCIGVILPTSFNTWLGTLFFSGDVISKFWIVVGEEWSRIMQMPYENGRICISNRIFNQAKFCYLSLITDAKLVVKILNNVSVGWTEKMAIFWKFLKSLVILSADLTSEEV